MDEGFETQSIQPADYAARRSERALERAAASRRFWVLIALAATAGAVVLGMGAEVALTNGRVHPGVSVRGVAVGGMTPQSARAALEANLPSRVTEPVTIRFVTRAWDVKPGQVDLGFDYEAIVDSAMAVGRRGDLAAMFGQRAGAWFGGTEITPVAIADDAAIEAVLESIAEAIDVKPVDARVVVRGTELRVEGGKDGRELDRVATTKDVLAAFVAVERAVDATVVDRPVDITDAEAKAAATEAERMLDRPAVIAHKKNAWEFEPSVIGGWIEFTKVDRVTEGSSATETVLTPVISLELAEPDIAEKLGAEVGRPAKSATFTTAGGTVTIVPSQAGVGADTKRLAEDLTRELLDPTADRKVSLVTARTEPEITTAEARSMGIRERISTYTTTYDASAEARVGNIQTLGDALDGTLIAPGGTFSFNGEVGERTAEKGYSEAPAIVNGRLVPQLGGGICQVGTTLFNTIFESGLPVVQRRNHSFYISHYPAGRDATVSWGGPDFKFRNDLKQWVLLSVSYTSSSITISLYGTDPDYEVSQVKGPWTDMRDYPVTEVKDPTMKQGARVIEEDGVRGGSIVVKRIVKKNGDVVREDVFASVYRPKAQIVRVGTAKTPTAKPGAEPSTTP